MKPLSFWLFSRLQKSKREDATEKYRSKWAALSDEEKVKYVRKAEDHNMKFQVHFNVLTFCLDFSRVTH